MKLVKRKECWVLTRWGWMLLLAISALSLLYFTRNINSFLCVSQPLHAELLVVEEWVSLRALERAASEFKKNDYSILAVLGNQRQWVAPILKRAGVDESRIVVIAFEPARKDRTFSAAVALRDWIKCNGIAGKAINIFTQGAHARRSWILFQKALGPECKVGIISFENPDHDPERWWKTSEGFKTVIGETIAYIYTQFFFFPSKP